MESRIRFMGKFCNICNFCLSTGRRTVPVEELPKFVLRLHVLSTQSPTARLCWECCAHLRGYAQFCERAERAQQTLINAHLYGEDYFEGKCLSKLTISPPQFTNISSDVSFTLDLTSNEGCSFMPIIPFEPVKEETLSPTSADPGSPPECEAWSPADDMNLEDIKYERRKKKKRSQLNKDPSHTVFEEPIISDTIDSKNEFQDPNIYEPKIEIEVNVSKSDGHAKQVYDKKYFEMFVVTDAELGRYFKLRGEYKCLMCLMTFKAMDIYIKHMAKYHPDNTGAYACDICAMLSPSETALERHREQHYVMYRCRVSGCNFVHKFPPKLRAHKRLHAPRKSHKTRQDNISKRTRKDMEESGPSKRVRTDRPEIYECDHCHSSFSNRRLIHVHMQRVHLPKRVVCEQCAYVCNTQTQLKLHMLAHLDPSHRKYECHVCHKKFRDNYKLRLHEFCHNGKRRNRCKACKTEFISEELLLKHNETRHGIKGETSEAPPRSKIQSRTKSKFVYGRRVNEKSEADSYHMYGSYRAETDKYQCYTCLEEFPDAETLKTHAKWHKDKELKCEMCDKMFKYKSLLETHVNRIHLKNRPFKCHICTAGSWTKTDLAKHLMTHSNERPFKCDMCNASFKYGSGLWTHKAMHKGEKPYMCNICGTSFALSSNLKKHMKMHTGEKPFECGVCTKRFPYKRNLRNHLKEHEVKETLMHYPHYIKGEF